MIGLTIVPDVVDGRGAPGIAGDRPLAAAIERLAAAGAGEALAVLAADGGLIGLLDAGGVVAALAAGGAAALALPVAIVAQPAGDWLAGDDSALDAIELMRLRCRDHLPVRDDGGLLIGLCSRRRLCELLHAAYDAETEARHLALFGISPGSG